MSLETSSTASPKKGKGFNPGGVPGNAGRGTKVFTLECQERFLKKYRKYKNVDRAARAIGFRGTTVFRQIRSSERFAAQYMEVRQEIMESLEEKMFGMAIGTEIPVHNSQLTAMFGVLKAFRPERWRENIKVGVGAEGEFATFLQGMTSALAVVATKAVPSLPASVAPLPALEHQNGNGHDQT